MALKWKEEHNHKGHPRVLRKEKASSSCISVYTSSCDPKGSSEPGQDETAVPIYERHANGNSDNLAIRICNCFFVLYNKNLT